MRSATSATALRYQSPSRSSSTASGNARPARSSTTPLLRRAARAGRAGWRSERAQRAAQPRGVFARDGAAPRGRRGRRLLAARDGAAPRDRRGRQGRVGAAAAALAEPAKDRSASKAFTVRAHRAPESGAASNIGRPRDARASPASCSCKRHLCDASDPWKLPHIGRPRHARQFECGASV